jgi:hypothetical protein
MEKEDLDRLWSDKRNWTPAGLYRCPADPRLIVPKRIWWLGWTLNIAHAASKRLSAVIVAAALVCPVLAPCLGQSLWEGALASLIVVSAICMHFASKTS